MDMKKKPENTGKVSSEEISELEETIKESEEDENKDKVFPEGNEDVENKIPEEFPLKNFEINPDFMEDLNLIDIPLPQTEPIFQRVQDSEESLEQNLQFAPAIKIREKKYDESKYDSKYFEDKYSKETPNYTGTTETEKKETSNKKKNQVNQFR